ncbi:peptide ABC transporter substrate-binding protein [Brevibacillus sp. RS1.1]|uniref:peptide ABC transporter substrate-binding protein n=1 Tax=Brevibacillus sp. RS1.1 TaxID=2738982 RepID=UPI00156B6E52|nr:peptide ABC transporter substrate-binding protein [Brevibacillus sp. RS1.1]NRR02729.1 peptide ABC transporter substrate-binding protein [Brevibacillus sp. RS1.1]
MKKGLLTFVALLALAVPALSACGSDKSAASSDQQTGTAIKQVMTANLRGEPYTLDPAFASDTTSYWVIDHLYEGLYRYSQNGDISEGAAEKVEVSPDGKTYTFTLRPEMKWSNGDPVTAHDYEYSWKRVLNPQTAAYEPSALYYIQGAEAYNTGKGSVDDVQIKAKDDRTLIVGLKDPITYFPKIMMSRAYLPVNKKVVDADKNWAAEAKGIVTNGPYTVGSWDHNSQLTIAKSQSYWEKEKVAMDTVHFKMVNEATTYYQMFKTGALDLIDSLPIDVIEQEKEKEEYKSFPDYSIYTYTFNVEEKPFTNAKIRQAFSYAIDRDILTKNVTKGGQLPAYGYTPFGVKTPSGKDFREEVAPYYQFDPTKAKQLLAEGLKEEGWTELPPITLKYSTAENHKKIAEALQEMFKQNLGVPVKLENQEWKTYIDTFKQKNFQIARMGWGGDYLDPLAMLELYTGKSSRNFTNWANPKFDELIEKAKVEQNEEARMKLLHDAETILMQDMPVIPVYFNNENYLNSKKIEGIRFSVTGTPDLRWAKRVAE